MDSLPAPTDNGTDKGQEQREKEVKIDKEQTDAKDSQQGLKDGLKEQNGEKDEKNGGEESNLNKRPPKETTSDLRICLLGVREFTKDYEIIKDLDKIFPDEDLGVAAIIKEPKKSFFFLKFVDLEHKDKFAAKGSFMLRNREVKMREAHVARGALKKERTIEHIRKFIENRQDGERQKMVAQGEEFKQVFTKETVEEALKDRICPYATKPYSEQTELKQAKLQGYLHEIKHLAKQKVKEEEIQTMDWLKSDKEGCCELNNIVECPENSKKFYRTKTEFTIGFSAMEQKLKIGFNISDSKKTFHSIELSDSAENLQTLPHESVQIAKIAEELMRECEWPIYDKVAHKGFWRFMVVRISKKTNQILVNLVGNKKHFEDDKFDTEFLPKFAVPFYKKVNESEHFKTVKLVGVTFQHTDNPNDFIPYVEDEELNLICGESKTYQEKIGDCLFEVSNSSFLQINISQSEQMYEYARKLAGLDKNTILLDICSGIGTIGITVGKNCHKIVGIEMVKSSCTNALKNAERNNMADKYEVVIGKVEDKIEEVVAKYAAREFKIVGIIDPPRAGLHPDVVRSLRTCRGLDDLIFICCDIKQSKTNIIDLCLPQSKKRRGPPFSPISCTAFDMFPQTPHFESLFCLKRLYEDLA